LVALLTAWDSLGCTIPADAIRSGLERLVLDRDALRGHIHFNDRTYQRTLIHSAESYEVLILCWRSGQRSPIHDHGHSTCGVLVLEGTATETSFSASPCGRLVPTHSRRIEAGSSVVSRGGDIHQVANLEATGSDLISLHVYSPRLWDPRVYRIADTTLAEHDRLVDSPPETIVARL
jgi:cysteine dioxygenase